MDTDVEYHMKRSGSTVGRASGSFRSWQSGDKLMGPKGEFDHLPDRYYETRPTQEGRGDVPRYYVGEPSGNGWYPVIDSETGESVDGESERSEEEAQANADRLNAEA